MASSALLDDDNFQHHRRWAMFAYVVVGLACFLFAGFGVYAWDLYPHQRSFVYQTVYDGRLLGPRSELDAQQFVMQKHVHHFHPQWVIVVPAALFGCYNWVPSLLFHCRKRNTATEYLALHRWHFHTAPLVFGATASWLVTLVLFLTGIRDAGHLISLFIYHCHVFGMLHPSIMRRLSSSPYDIPTKREFTDQSKWYMRWLPNRDDVKPALITLMYFIPLALVQASNYAFTSQRVFDQSKYLTVWIVIGLIGLFLLLCCWNKAKEDRLWKMPAVKKTDINDLIMMDIHVNLMLMKLIATSFFLLYWTDDLLDSE